jgi:hypothetical protein
MYSLQQEQSGRFSDVPNELQSGDKIGRLLRTLCDDYVVESHAQRLFEGIPEAWSQLVGFPEFIDSWLEDESRHAEVILDLIKSSLGDKAAEEVVVHAKHVTAQSVDSSVYGDALNDPFRFLVAFLYDEVFTRESYRLDALQYKENNRPKEARAIALIAKDEGQHASAVAELLVRNAELLVKNFVQDGQNALNTLLSEISKIVDEAIEEDRSKKEAIRSGEHGRVYPGLFIGDHDGYPDELFNEVKSHLTKILETTIKKWLSEKNTEE